MSCHPSKHRGGPASRACRASAGDRGFTLLEVLLALALLALIAGVLVSGSVNLLGDKPVNAEDVFWQAVQKGRTAALKTEHDIRLTFDAKERSFVLDDGTAPKILPVPRAKELTVDFLGTSATSRSTILVGGELVESQPIPFVTFYADGTCTPFRVQFRTGGAARVVSIDPWTCARVLPKVEGTP